MTVCMCHWSALALVVVSSRVTLRCKENSDINHILGGGGAQHGCIISLSPLIEDVINFYLDQHLQSFNHYLSLKYSDTFIFVDHHAIRNQNIHIHTIVLYTHTLVS